jgi:hypothetical protein
MKIQNTNRAGDAVRYARQNAFVGMTRLPRLLLGFGGAIMATALLLVVLMAGCTNEDKSIAGFCDNTPPLATAVSPACGSADVALNQKVIVNFNKAMNSSTVTVATFTLAGPGGTPVTGAVTYVTATNTATFTPEANLSAGTTYTYTIKGGADGVKDQSGNALANDFFCSFTTGASADVTPPTVISTDPANVATGVALNKIITAIFSEAMNPSTITTTTFTVKIGTTPVSGTVTYAGTGAIFTPASNFAVSTTYTATITIGAEDVAGNALASDYVWNFTTDSALPPGGPATVNLDCAARFAVLAGSTVTNTGNTIVDGDLGLSPGSAVTGFPPGTVVNGAIHINDAAANNAKLCLTTAYNDAAGRTLNVIVVSDGELGGKTLAPGLYKSAPGSFGITSSNLTLDAGGDANATWIFQMPSSTLTVGNGRQVILAGGAQAKNIFWQVGTSATIGTTAAMKGTILADQSITLRTGATLIGRALTRIAAVTLDANAITIP